MWQLVHDRLAIPRQAYLRATKGGLRRAAEGGESKYLLTGMTTMAGAGPPSTYAAAAMDAGAREHAVPGLATTK